MITRSLIAQFAGTVYLVSGTTMLVLFYTTPKGGPSNRRLLITMVCLGMAIVSGLCWIGAHLAWVEP